MGRKRSNFNNFFDFNLDDFFNTSKGFPSFGFSYLEDLRDFNFEDLFDGDNDNDNDAKDDNLSLKSDPNLDYQKEEGTSNGRSWTKETWSNENTHIVRTYIKRSDDSDVGDSDTIKHLESKLKSAIKEERFEDAAKLRDKIKKIKSKN